LQDLEDKILRQIGES